MQSQQPTVAEETTTAVAASSHQFTFPFDLVAEILRRLPVKPLIRFKSLSKSFDALISDPQFAKEQFRATDPTNPRNHLVITNWDPPRHSNYSITTSGAATATWLDSPCTKELSGGTMVGSCHGMLCVFPRIFEPILWNPLTGKLKSLPPAIPLEPQRYASTSLGFGYDHLSHSYKVVAVHPLASHGINKNDVQVLTVGTDSWRSIQPFPTRCSTFDNEGKFLNCKLHWLAKDWFNFIDDDVFRFVIVSLDLATEMYHEKLLLPPVGPHDEAVPDLYVLKGCLCIGHPCDNEVYNVWLMRDYGNNESWTKLFTVPSPGIVPIRVSGEEDDELLFFRSNLDDDTGLFVYNSKSGTFNAPHGINNSRCCLQASVYSESLISP